MFRRILSLIAASAFAVFASPTIGLAQAVVPISGLPAAAAAAPADLTVCVHSGTTSKCTMTQVWSPAGPIIYQGAGSSGTATQTWCAQDAGAIAGILCNVPASSTFGYRFNFGGSTVAQITNYFAIGTVTGSPSTGDLLFGRTTSTGEICAGTAVTKCLDLGITTAGTWTFSGGAVAASSFSGSGSGLTAGTIPNAALVTTPLNVSGTAQTKTGSLTVAGITSSSGGATISGVIAGTSSTLEISALGSFSTPSILTGGDGAFQRTASSGVAALGGATSCGFIDYGVTTASTLSSGNCAGTQVTWAHKGPLTVAPTINSTTIASSVAPVYSQTGATIATTAHTSMGSCTMAASTSCTITFTNNAVFSSQSSYACSSGTNGTTPFFMQNGNGAIVTVIASASNSTTFYASCTGF